MTTPETANQVNQEIEPLIIKKCSASDVLGENLIRMLHMNPTNAQVRAAVMAKCLLPVPKECETYEQVIDWIERTVEPKVEIPSPKAHAAPNETARVSALTLNVSGSEIEYGRARYSASRSGRGQISIGVNSLREMADSCEDMEELRESVREYINDHFNDQIEMETDNYEYDNEEATGSEDFCWDYEPMQASADEMISRALREHLPEEYERLNH